MIGWFHIPRMHHCRNSAAKKALSAVQRLCDEREFDLYVTATTSGFEFQRRGMPPLRTMRNLMWSFAVNQGAIWYLEAVANDARQELEQAAQAEIHRARMDHDAYRRHQVWPC